MIVPRLSSLPVQSILRALLALTTAVVTLRLGAGIAFWRAANNLESPTYEVVRRLPPPPSAPRGLYTRNGGAVEVRRYDSYLIAETTVEESSMRKAGGAGFGRCAGYIFGKNLPSGRRGGSDAEKMAMTSPVRTVGKVEQQQGEKMAMTSPVRSAGNVAGMKGKTKVSFVVGSKYDLKSAPKPVDKAVKVRRVEEHYLAARTFAGPPPSDERVRAERSAIEGALAEAGIRTKKGGDGGETMVYGYHDPIVTPNILRRNEVAVMVDGSTVK